MESAGKKFTIPLNSHLVGYELIPPIGGGLTPAKFIPG